MKYKEKRTSQNLNLFLRRSLAIFRHPESSSGQVVVRYIPQNELRLTKKYPAQKVSIIQCLSSTTKISNH